MRWSDEALVLSTRRHGESGLLVHLLTRDHGRHAGLVRGGQRPKARVAYQIGNRLAVTWSARLAEHLGTLQGELEHGYAAALIDAPARLAGLAAAAALADAALPEREPHQRVFQGLVALCESLAQDAGWMPAYVEWELALLAELGFGLDLASCAVTGATADLVYVSPKSGRAVSAGAGEAYRARLLRLPPFLGGASGAAPATSADVLDGLALTGFFLGARVFAPHRRGLPPARTRFVELLRRFVTLARG
jgi:DNA repair protein RecO (recombination protein O)